MRKVMIDLETFGTSVGNACVVQIGACYFNDEGLIDNSFKVNIDAENAQANGAILDASTVYWWLRQSEDARHSVSFRNLTPEFLAFTDLNEFLKDADEIWSHATFDFVIVMEALKRLKIKPSFSYRAARDIRTLVSLAYYTERLERTGVHHDALHDAVFQVEYVTRALNKLRGKI